MRIAVTGGAGRIGQVVTAAALAAGHDVVVLDGVVPSVEVRPRNFHQVDMTNYPAVRTAVAGADAVVHLAGIASPVQADEVHVHNNNVVASYNVLQAAAEKTVRRVVMASSVNAVGATWSRAPTFDYFPVDRHHPTHNEDGYSLSKWIGEQQADSMTRRYSDLSVASLRIHAFVRDRSDAVIGAREHGEEWAARGLWGYTTHAMLTSACLRACEVDVIGHHVFWVVSPVTSSSTPSRDLAAKFYPDVPLHAPLEGHRSFFVTTATEQVLGWSPTAGAT